MGHSAPLDDCLNAEGAGGAEVVDDEAEGSCMGHSAGGVPDSIG